MAEGSNGSGLTALQQAQAFVVQAGALFDRMGAAQRLGYSYGGLRDVYEALGWPKYLTWDHYHGRYQRQDIAGRIVDLPADATWREGFKLKDDEDPDAETPFEKAWLDLDRRLRLSAWIARLDRVAGIGEYAALYLGVRGQNPVSPLRRAQPGDLMYAAVFPQPAAEIERLDEDELSDRFGLPEVYSLTVSSRTTAGAGPRSVIGSGQHTGRTVLAHHSRIIHAAEAVEDSVVYGRPRLQRVFNLLCVLELIAGSTGEAFWRGARPRYHGNIDPEFSGSLQTGDLERLVDEFAKFIHGYQDFLRTSGTQVQQFMATVGDPRGPADVVLDLISAATGIPKRILLGSERGELASSQDAQEWAHRVAERQLQYAEPTLVRPLIDRLIATGILPEPSEGEYEIEWPDLTGPSADQRALLAEKIANVEAKRGQAKLTRGLITTDNEIREVLGMKPIPELKEDYPGQREEERLEEERKLLEEQQEEQLLLPAPAPGAPDEDEDEPEDLKANATFAQIIRAVGAATDRLFASETVERIQLTVMDLARRTGERLGLTEVDPVTQASREFMANYGAARVGNISETTRKLLRQTLTDGLRRGESNRLLARRVRTYFRQVSAGRARVIAATEAHNAAAEGVLIGLQQAGATHARWAATIDNKTRPEHLELGGQIQPLGRPFVVPSNPALSTMRPGAFGIAEQDINCRCTLVPVGEPAALAALQADEEFLRRLDVHERRVLAGVRRGLRKQRDAVLRELAE